jgi:hypothetical protein
VRDRDPVTAVLDLWKVVRLADIRQHPRRDDIRSWIASIGVDVMTITPALAVSQDSGDRSYRLHLSRFVVDAHGGKVVDHAAEQMHTEPLVIPIDSWPDWLLTEGAH